MNRENQDRVNCFFATRTGSPQEPIGCSLLDILGKKDSSCVKNVFSGEGYTLDGGIECKFQITDKTRWEDIKINLSQLQTTPQKIPEVNWEPRGGTLKDYGLNEPLKSETSFKIGNLEGTGLCENGAWISAGGTTGHTDAFGVRGITLIYLLNNLNQPLTNRQVAEGIVNGGGAVDHRHVTRAMGEIYNFTQHLDVVHMERVSKERKKPIVYVMYVD